MIHLDDRTVELDELELAAKEAFEALLDKGHGIPFAAKLAINQFRLAHDTAFVAWLSDNTLIRRASRVYLTAEARKLTNHNFKEV